MLANVSILLDCACLFLVKCGSKETSLADLQNQGDVCNFHLEFLVEETSEIPPMRRGW